MSTSSSRKIAAANGFGRGSLTVAEAWALYHARYPVPPDMRLPSSGGWKMAVNGIGVPPPPKPRTDQWRDAIKARRAQLTAEERLDPTWAVNDNDAWWTTYFQAKYDVEMHSTDNLVGGPNSWNREGRALFWGVPGRTLENVIRGLRNGAPRLEMPSSPPPSPQWQPRRTTYSSSSHSSSSGPARSTPSSSYRSAPYTVPKREVKEEPATPVNTRRGGSGSGRQQGRRGGALLIPKPEVKEEPEEASQAALLAEYERQQRLIASSDDPEDCPGLRAAFLASMDDKDAWRGDLDAAIAMSIRDSGKPLVDLTDDGEAGPSGLVKDEPVDEPVDERGKQEVVTDEMYNFQQYYDASGRRKRF